MKRQFRILLIMFLLSAVLLSFGHLALSGEKKDRPTIKMFLNLSSNRTKYEYYRDRTIQKPVMEYYPQNDITDGLKKAGFRILPEDSKDYDLALEVNYKERFYSISIGPGQTMERIDRTVGFVLRNKEGTVIFADDMPGDPKEEAVKRYFKEELPKLVKERPTSADMVLALSDKLKKEGFDRDVLKRLGRLNDPRAIDAIVPLLRICYASYRWDVKFALWDLGYKPTSKSEKAAFDIVDLVDPFTWYYKYGKKPPKRSPLEIIEAYGIPAVDLFLEDLKCEPKLGYYAGNATAENAKKALRSLESKARSKEYNPEWEKHAAGRLVGDLTKEDAESKFRSGYIIDVIGLLAIVGDEHAIAPLKNYLDKPNYSEYAAKAIENIEKRKALPEKKSEILPTKKMEFRSSKKKEKFLRSRKS